MYGFTRIILWEEQVSNVLWVTKSTSLRNVQDVCMKLIFYTKKLKLFVQLSGQL